MTARSGAGWVRLADWCRSGAVDVTPRTARRWVTEGIGGVMPPAGAVRRFAGRWWVNQRAFAEWIEGAGCADAEGSEPAGSRTREVFDRWDKVMED